MTMSLPVFELGRPELDPGRVAALAADLFELEGEVTEDGERLSVSDENLLLEVFVASGDLFAADRAQLWNPSLRPSLPKPEEAYDRARELIRRHDLWQTQGDLVELVELGAGATHVAARGRRRARADRRSRQLDVQARFVLGIRNPGVDSESKVLPVIGGGGKLTLTFGDGGRLIGANGGFRPIGEPHVVDALDVDEAFARLGADGDLGEVDRRGAYLAYYMAPGDVVQELLTPVWVFTSDFEVEHAGGKGSSTVHARHTFVAATDHGPVFPEAEVQPERSDRAPAGRAPRSERAARALNPSEAGTSWVKQIDQSQPLNGSPANAQGFVDGLSADGWQTNFNWGDLNAWESDWHSDDDTWVDAADFVFYTGHANQNGWVLCVPGKKQSVLLTPSAVGAAPASPGDLYGQNDLEWFAVAACGPLQDDVISPGGGDVLSRWDGAFDGLHTMLGYGAITFDNTDEGRKLARYTRDGMSVIDAWFRTAREVQPATNNRGAPDGPDIWVGAMWVTKAGVDPSSDHIWGHGSVSADPAAPSQLVCMWTTC
ncbi:DUF6345 domain-containing protein [Terrabacter sp. Soil810]|uniref:DUF6345 domain-containing protein n=1 Tax=Terrabacter sp. Soil810 TaxID=1736418 RepID=UPI00070A61A2|nr:DUF6345 domain-containing protein [Terrabacter sp. Soil810]KRF46609.1 hypothetical protein ASG96_00760 [Terrabacter sp. Soil810]